MKINHLPLHLQLSQYTLSINKLYESLDVPERQYKLKMPKKMPLFFENLFISRVTIINLDAIRKLIDEATKIIEDNILESKSAVMTNDRITDELDSAKLEILRLKTEIEKVNGEIPEMDFKTADIYIELTSKNKNLQQEVEQQFLTFVKEIILMRDNLCMKEEVLKTEEKYQETNVWKLIQASYRETEAILKRMGIIIVNETGVFNSNIQLVTDTVATDVEELHDTVAQTFREGYRTVNKIIRPQEVVLYTYNC